MKRKVIALIIAAVMSLPGIAAVAADPEITCNLDTAAEEKKLYVAADSGTFEKDTVINLVIMNPGRMLDKAAETGAVFYADGKKADNMGRVSFEVSFDKAALGIYQIYLIPSGSGETYTQEVTYLMGDFDKRFLEKINGDDGATTEGIKAVMTSDDAKTFLKDTISEELKDDSFRPDSPILRQEFCKVLTVGLNPEKTDEAISFSDVAADAWYTEFVQRAAAAGYVKGKTDGSFGVDESLTREDLAVILERIVKAMPEVTVGDTAAEYNDFDKVSDYAAEAVKYVTAAGLMEGYDGGFAPKENVTRAQIAAVLGRLLYEL